LVRDPAESNADTGIVDRRAKPVGTRKCFDGRGAFRPEPVFDRPDALQFVVKNNTRFARAEAIFDVAEEYVQVAAKVRQERDKGNQIR
jgi:hypothetical protein